MDLRLLLLSFLFCFFGGREKKKEEERISWEEEVMLCVVFFKEARMGWLASTETPLCCTNDRCNRFRLKCVHQWDT